MYRLEQKDISRKARAKGRKRLQQKLFWMEDRPVCLACTSYLHTVSRILTIAELPAIDGGQERPCKVNEHHGRGSIMGCGSANRGSAKAPFAMLIRFPRPCYPERAILGSLTQVSRDEGKGALIRLSEVGRNPKNNLHQGRRLTILESLWVHGIGPPMNAHYGRRRNLGERTVRLLQPTQRG
jgi:hypothetical protein